jgi:hypothetical protein
VFDVTRGTVAEGFQNMLPRRIFGRRKKDIIGNWRKFRNEELHDIYWSPNRLS